MSNNNYYKQVALLISVIPEIAVDSRNRRLLEIDRQTIRRNNETSGIRTTPVFNHRHVGLYLRDELSILPRIYWKGPCQYDAAENGASHWAHWTQ